MILGVDLGKKTTGLAISDSQLASPYLTITHKSSKEAVEKITKIADELGAQKIIVGFVEGKIKKMFENFTDALKSKKLDLEIIMWDETLTSGQAQDLLIKLQVRKNRRHQKEHEVAAALILQSYLDEVNK